MFTCKRVYMYMKHVYDLTCNYTVLHLKCC